MTVQPHWAFPAMNASISLSTLVAAALAIGVIGSALSAEAQDKPASANLPEAVDSAATASAGAKSPKQLLQELRQEFQSQELITAKPNCFIFNAGTPPRIIWRDAEEARRLGCEAPLRVRWFDARLNEITTASEPGRYGAYIEGISPNGTPVRRAMTFYCRPSMFLWYNAPRFGSGVAYQAGPIPEEVWNEHQDEIAKTMQGLLFRQLFDSQEAAIMLAGLSAQKPLGRLAAANDTAQALDEDYHLALKLKVLGLDIKTRVLERPLRRNGSPATILRNGLASKAGMRADAKARIEKVCADWAADSEEPFTVLVARRGIVVAHRAFGRDESGDPIGLDYRGDVASISKSITGILLTEFLDQGLIKLDDPVSRVLPDYPTTGPTFRDCVAHMTGFSGHGNWGGVKHPYLDNILLNGIDATEPGSVQVYTGMGYDLIGKAMEIVTGKTARKVIRDHLFRPLGFGDVPVEGFGAGISPTSWELGVLAQLLINKGRYGNLEFFSAETFERHLPEDLSKRYPNVHEEYGLGIGWRPERKPGASADSTRPEDFFFSQRTLGHGSISQCLLRADLDQELIVVMIRKQAGPRFNEWIHKFYRAVSDSVVK
jgi:CubicO group peptidase (beta-lactamase class C family)